MHFLSLHQPAWLETRPQGIEAKRRAVPHRRRAHGRAAPRGPTRLVQRVLQLRPLACAVTQTDHLGPFWDHLAHQLDSSDVEGLRAMPFGALAHAPRQGQSAPLLDHVEPQRHAATADDTAIHDYSQRL
jgi:hypothetical protein